MTKHFTKLGRKNSLLLGTGQPQPVEGEGRGRDKDALWKRARDEYELTNPSMEWFPELKGFQTC